jgi:hypothetical protein
MGAKGKGGQESLAGGLGAVKGVRGVPCAGARARETEPTAPARAKRAPRQADTATRGGLCPPPGDVRSCEASAEQLS